MNNFVRNDNPYKALKVGQYSPIVSDKEIKDWLRDIAEDDEENYFDFDISNYLTGDRDIDIINAFSERWTPDSNDFSWRHKMHAYIKKLGLLLRNHPSPHKTVISNSYRISTRN